MIDTKKGKCLLCASEGETGKECPGKACRQYGLHFIPVEFMAAAKKRPIPFSHIGRAIDDMIIVKELGDAGVQNTFLCLQIPSLTNVVLTFGQSSPLYSKPLEYNLTAFENEATQIEALNHPNILRLLKHGTFRNIPYIVTHHCEGGNTLYNLITARAGRKEVFEPPHIRAIVEQTLNALDFAHSRKIIHGNLNPKNILLEADPRGKYMVHVLEFGISSFIVCGFKLKPTMDLPIYKAPEQLTGGAVGPWSDIYALGVITHEMFFSRQPFTGVSVSEIRSRKVDLHFDPLKDLRKANIPDFLISFFEKTFESDGSKRFQTAVQFGDEFISIINKLKQSDAFYLSINVKDLADALSIARPKAIQAPTDEPAVVISEPREPADEGTFDQESQPEEKAPPPEAPENKIQTKQTQKAPPLPEQPGLPLVQPTPSPSRTEPSPVPEPETELTEGDWIEEGLVPPVPEMGRGSSRLKWILFLGIPAIVILIIILLAIPKKGDETSGEGTAKDEKSAPHEGLVTQDKLVGLEKEGKDKDSIEKAPSEKDLVKKEGDKTASEQETVSDRVQKEESETAPELSQELQATAIIHQGQEGRNDLFCPSKMISIQVDAPRAEVFIDGKSFGKPPVQFQFYERVAKIWLKVESEGVKPYNRIIDYSSIKDNETINVQFSNPEKGNQ